MMAWQQVKEIVEAWTGLERDALHVYAAVGVHLCAAIIVRRPLSHILPWLCVLGIECANEAYDLLNDRLVEQWEIAAGLHDLWNTMLLPSLMLLLARYAPALAVGRARPNSSEAPEETG